MRIRSISRVMIMVMILSMFFELLGLGPNPTVRAGSDPDMDILLEENFDSIADGGPLPAGWEQGGVGTWTIEEGTLVGESTTADTLYVLFGDSTWTDYTVEAKISFISAVAATRWASIMYREGPNGVYQFPMRKNGGDNISFKAKAGKWVGKYPVPDHAVATAPGYNEWHTLKVVVQGSNVRHYYDGILLYEQDIVTEQLQGRAGLGLDRVKVRFDDVKVTKIEAVSMAFSDVPDEVEANTVTDFEINALFNTGRTLNVTGQAVITSSDDTIARVEDGKLLALKEGSVVITAAYQGIEREWELSVAPSIAPITVLELVPSLQAISLVIGQDKQLSVTGKLSNFTTEDKTPEADWSSEDETVATVSAGVVTPLTVGETRIKVTMDGAEAEIPIKVWADPADDNLWISENFDDIPDGQIPSGWNIVEGAFAVVDGKLKGVSPSINSSARILLPFDLDTGDYTFEADVAFESVVEKTRWTGLMYRVQPTPNYNPYLQFVARQGASEANGLEFNSRTAANTWDVRLTNSYSSVFELNQSYHMKVIASKKRIQNFINGTKVFDSDMAADLQTGGLGLHVNGSTVLFDNVRVSINPGTLPVIVNMPPFEPTQPNTGLVTAPTVAAEGIDSLSSIVDLDGSGVSSVLLQVGSAGGDNLQVVHNGNSLGSLEDVLTTIQGKLIPILQIEEAELASTVADCLDFLSMSDVLIVSSTPDIVKEVRTHLSKTRGAVEFMANSFDEAGLKQIIETVRENDAIIAVLNKQAATPENIQYLQARAISVWVKGVSDLKTSHEIIHSGANGILSGEPLETVKALEQYPQFTMAQTPVIIAHRGVPTLAPENTMSGFRAAIGFHPSIIETDIVETKDGELVIMHDTTVNSTTNGTGPVKDYTLEELRMLDAGSKFSPAFAGEKVPTLREFLQLLKTSDVALIAELKTRGIEERVVRMLEEEDMLSSTVVSSFTGSELSTIRSLNPKLGTVYVPSSAPPSTDKYQTAATSLEYYNKLSAVVAPTHGNLYPEWISYGSSRGALYWPWTIDNVDTMTQKLKMGINGLYTNVSNTLLAAPIRLDAETAALTIKVGDSVSIKAKHFYRDGSDRVVNPKQLVVLENGQNIQVNGNTVKGLTPGTTLVMAKQTFSLAGATWNHFTQPIEITILADDASNPPESLAPDIDSIGLSQGTELLTTKVTGLQDNAAYRYTKGDAGSKQRPIVGDDPTGYTRPLISSTNIAVAPDDHIFVIELDVDGKIAGWKDLLVTVASIKSTTTEVTSPGTGTTGPNTDPTDPDTAVTLPESVTLLSTEVKKEVERIVRQNGTSSNAELQLLADGFTYAPAVGKESTTVKIPVQKPTNDAPAGVYKVGNDGSLVYVGGKLSDNTMEVTLSEAGNYVVLTYDKKFIDLNASHWAYEAVRQLSAMQVVAGKTVAEFAPQSKVTRAEFISMLVKAFGLKASGQSSFTDVDASFWYSNSLAAAEEAGLAFGLGNGKFEPNKTVSREQMAAFLVRAYEIRAKQSADRTLAASFKDGASVSDWAQGDLNAATKLGLVRGHTSGNFEPANETLRAEAAVAILNLINSF